MERRDKFYQTLEQIRDFRVSEGLKLAYNASFKDNSFYVELISEKFQMVERFHVVWEDTFYKIEKCIK